MATNICQRVGSFIQGLNTSQKMILAGATSVTCWWVGLPTVLIASAALGGFFVWDKDRLSSPEKPAPQKPPESIRVVPPLVVPLPDDEKEAADATLSRDSFPLAADTRLAPPVGRPPQIIWKDNCCFLSSALWSFFLNEPAVLRELPASIGKRLQKQIFSGSITGLSQNKSDALIRIQQKLQKQEMPKQDLRELCLDFQILEWGGFPKGMDARAANSLLSLLDLYFLIDYCQNSDSVDSRWINRMRGMVHRVNPRFKETGTECGDAQEVLLILADLIFEGSSLQRDLHTTRTYTGNGYTLPTLPGEDEILNAHTGIICNPKTRLEYNPETGERTTVDSNWGRFELALNPGDSVQQMLNKHLMPGEPYERDCYAEGVVDDTGKPKRMPFQVTERFQFNRPPELLVLTLKRYNGVDPMAEVNAERFITLDALNGEKGRYELVGVSRRFRDFAHYDAYIKRTDDTHYHCDDLRGKRDLCASVDLVQAARQGYVLIYTPIGLKL